MKTYDQSIHCVAKQYSKEALDSMSPRFPFEKAEMLSFIFDVDLKKVVKQIKTVEIDYRSGRLK